MNEEELLDITGLTNQELEKICESMETSDPCIGLLRDFVQKLIEQIHNGDEQCIALASDEEARLLAEGFVSLIVNLQSTSSYFELVCQEFFGISQEEMLMNVHESINTGRPLSDIVESKEVVFEKDELTQSQLNSLIENVDSSQVN